MFKSLLKANGDWMATHRVDLCTMEESSWTASPIKKVAVIKNETLTICTANS